MKFFQLQYPLLLVLLLLILRCEHSYSSQLHNTNRIRCLERERQALLNFKSQLVDTHGRLSSWGNHANTRDDCCEWSGIHCHNRTNHVTQLDLGYYDIRGNISNSLLELQHLRYLNLRDNDFEYAPIPEFIGSLTKLRHLDLALANFGGPIPRQIGNLSTLHFLDISDNHNCYSENLDWVFNLGSLEHLDLSSTNLTKATNLVQAISKLTSIKELHLSWVSLPEIPLSLLPKINGSSPLAILDLSLNWHPSIMTLFRWFSNFSTVLTSIDLSDNSILGFIPNDFEYMMSLEYLSLGGNGLQGGIPKHFGNLSSLTSLRLSDNNLTGDISKVMMNLSIGPLEKKLEYLDLSWNKFSGTFPNMSRFSSLDTLLLDGNNLSGSMREGYL